MKNHFNLKNINEKPQKHIIVIFIGLFLSVALSVNYYYHTSSAALVHPDNSATFKSFSGSFERYCEMMPKAWRPRLFSNYLAGFFVGKESQGRALASEIGLWSAIWFFICSVGYLAIDRRYGVYLILGTFAALNYSLTPMAQGRIYPWDLPPMFFFILMYYLCSARRVWALIIVLAMGVGFKETVAVGCIVFLFWSDLEIKTRLIYFLLSVIACATVKITIDLITGNPSIGYTMITDFYGPLVGLGIESTGIMYNVKAIFQLYLNHPIFINGGSFLVFLLLPVRSSEDIMWKTVGLLFLLGVMLFGVINEYRIFVEMIPVSLWCIYGFIDDKRSQCST